MLHWFRRLRIRWEILDDIHEAFLSLACGIIRWRRLVNLCDYALQLALERLSWPR